ncbi:DUF2767 family protein [Enterobacter hormaechei]
MSEMKKLSEDLYREACRIVGECCLMLASNDAETNRDQLVDQVKRLHWEIMKKTDESNLPILLAIERLATSEDWKKPYLMMPTHSKHNKQASDEAYLSTFHLYFFSTFWPL